MFLENYFIIFNDKLTLNSIKSYRTIMIRFINKYIILNFINYKSIKDLFYDSIIYSKYYVNYKLLNCIYSDEIMQKIFDIDFI